MQNISAFFAGIGMPTIEGYKPSGSIGALVRTQLAEVFADLPSQTVETCALTDYKEDLTRKADVLREAKDLPCPIGNEKPRKTEATTTSYGRSPEVVASVLNRQAAMQACCHDAPFETDRREPFLEVHHVLSTSEGGPDVVENDTALCPNCQRVCHHAWNKEERAKRLGSTVRCAISLCSAARPSSLAAA